MEGITPLDEALRILISQNNFFLNLKINEYPLMCVIWNLALIFITYLIGKYLVHNWQKTNLLTFGDKFKEVTAGILWLLFIPNTAYLITGIRHIVNYCPPGYYHVCPQSAWMIPFFFIYAIIGWLSLVFLVNQVRNLLIQMYSEKFARNFVLILIPLIAIGVLIGLVDRWNSWEMMIHPNLIVKTIVQYFSSWIYFKNLLAFSLSFYLLYYIGDKLFIKTDLPVSFIKHPIWKKILNKITRRK